jgi:hypothetical protein
MLASAMSRRAAIVLLATAALGCGRLKAVPASGAAGSGADAAVSGAAGRADEGGGGGGAGGDMLRGLDGACSAGSAPNAEGICECPGGAASLCPDVGCTSLADDPANCGACGNACAPTAACLRGHCGPEVKTLVPATRDCVLREVAVAGGRLSWIDRGRGTVTTAGLDGSAPTIVATGEALPSQFVARGTGLFWIATSSKVGSGDIAMTSSTIRRLTLPGGPAVDLAAETMVRGLAVSDDGHTVYYSVEGAVKSVPAEGGTPVVAVTDELNPAGLALEGTVLAYPTSSNGAIDAVQLGGAGPASCGHSVVFGDAPADAVDCWRLDSGRYGIHAQLVVHDGFIYWADTGQISRGPSAPDAGRPEAFAISLDFTAVTGLVAGTDSLYFAAGSSIERVLTRGGAAALRHRARPELDGLDGHRREPRLLVERRLLDRGHAALSDARRACGIISTMSRATGAALFLMATAALACRGGRSPASGMQAAGGGGATAGTTGNGGSGGFTGPPCLQGAFPGPDGACECVAPSPTLCPKVGCTSLADDSANCGACGQACAPTAACLRGRCGPEVRTIVAAATLCVPRELAVVGGTLYWTDGTHETVSSARVDGSEASVAAAGESAPSHLVASGDSVYWIVTRPSTGDGGVMTAASTVRKLPRAGGAAVDLASEASMMNGLALSDDGSTVYYSVDDAVKAVPAAGGAPMVVANDELIPGALAVEGTTLAYPTLSGGSVDSIALGAGRPASCGHVETLGGPLVGANGCTRVIGGTFGLLTQIVIKDGLLYWALTDQIERGAGSFDAGTTHPFASAFLAAPVRGLVVAGDSLYFGAGLNIERAVLRGGSQAFVVARGQTATGSMATDGTQLFWSNGDCSIASQPL